MNKPIVLGTDEFITEAAIQDTNAKIFPAGTILVAMYGEGKTRGKATELGIAAATNQACAALLRPDNDTKLRSYVKYWFEYNYLRLRKQAAGGVQPNLNLAMIKRLKFPLPPHDEVAKIVDLLASDLDIVDTTRQEFDEMRRSVSALRQSVLKAAFEGRLVAQDPRDEPAEQLLARLSEQHQAQTETRRMRKTGGATTFAE